MNETELAVERHKAFLMGLNARFNGADLVNDCPFDDGERGFAWFLGYCAGQNDELTLIIEQQAQRVLQKARTEYIRRVGPQAANSN